MYSSQCTCFGLYGYGSYHSISCPAYYRSTPLYPYYTRAFNFGSPPKLFRCPSCKELTTGLKQTTGVFATICYTCFDAAEKRGSKPSMVVIEPAPTKRRWLGR